MTTRRSSRVYWLVGRIGTNRLVTRLHPPVVRVRGREPERNERDDGGAA